MTILDVIEKYDAGTLFQENDDTLYVIQTDIDKQVEAIQHDWNLTLFPDDIQAIWNKLQDISHHITATLNHRYGCND